MSIANNMGGTTFTGVEQGGKIQRKNLITVAEWSTGSDTIREILGTRTEDSSIELNPDIETITDILGITYTDVNKTEPQQDFDPFNLLEGSDLSEYLAEAFAENDITKYSNAFTVYIIEAFDMTSGKYKTIKHSHCSIIPTSLGGDAYLSMPIEVHFSNEIEIGSIDNLASNFEFTKD